MRMLVLAGALALASCGGTVVQERPTLAKVPVPQPCVAGDRPAAVAPLRERYSDAEWKVLDTRQKAAVVAKQGLDLRAYGENLHAATGGCD